MPPARQVRDSRSAGKAAILAAAAPQVASPIGQLETTLAVEVVETALVTVELEVERTASAVGISRAAVAAVEMPLGAVLADRS